MNLASNRAASSYIANSPNNTSLYRSQGCSDDHDEDLDCNMSASIDSSYYTTGNSAANTAMFYWSAPNTYNVCNQ